jgi:hypothetical protein
MLPLEEVWVFYFAHVGRWVGQSVDKTVPVNNLRTPGSRNFKLGMEIAHDQFMKPTVFGVKQS